MLEVISSILRSNRQPWLQQNFHDDRFYRQLLADIEVSPLLAPTTYRADIRELYYTPPMAQYYCALIDDELHTWLNDQYADLQVGLTAGQVEYRYTLLEQVFEELITHFDDIIFRHHYDIHSVIGRNATFTQDLQSKVCTIICYRAISSLVLSLFAWLDMMRPLLSGTAVPTSIDQYLYTVIGHLLPVEVSISEEEPLIPVDDTSLPRMTTKAEHFLRVVEPFNFKTLSKVSKLSSPCLIQLVESMVNDAAYAVAMLEFLGYPDYVLKTFNLSREKLYAHIAEALSSKSSTVKKYYLSLSAPENPSYEKHNAFIHTGTVQENYKVLLKDSSIGQ